MASAEKLLPKVTLDMMSAEKFLKNSSTTISALPPSLSILFSHDTNISFADSIIKFAIPWPQASLSVPAQCRPGHRTWMIVPRGTSRPPIVMSARAWRIIIDAGGLGPYPKGMHVCWLACRGSSMSEPVRIKFISIWTPGFLVMVQQ
ncbi:hypothetical protein U9M48_005501 [Paspalum notatum var. saurae]|uniref:Uncharacterized protein n=1 Tax=Paspalum notatum var. saurae TaxID=547442 RepID=A0AAQ3PM15_PASNO